MMIGYEALSITAAFASVLVAALLIMLSRAFDFKALEQSAKSELVFAASSVFVAIFLIAVIQYGSQIGTQVAEKMYVYTYAHAGYLHYTDADGNEHAMDESVFAGGTSMINISILYMRSVVYCAESVSRWVFRFDMAFHELSTISQDVFMAYPMSGWVWSGIAQSADNLLNTFYFVELIYRLQVYVLRFVDLMALPWLLPVGILMRAFPPTRGAGAYVIALTVSIYLVYPFAYMAAAFSSTYPNLCVTPQLPAPSFGENSKAGIASEFMMWYRAFEGGILDMIGKFSDFTSALMTNLCFLPFLALTLTMTVAQFSSGLFGANVNEIGRGLLKLI